MVLLFTFSGQELERLFGSFRGYPRNQGYKDKNVKVKKSLHNAYILKMHTVD
jgi:hypothetical protein